MPFSAMELSSQADSLLSQQRVPAIGLPALGRQQSAIVDFAAGGGSAGISVKALDGVFCFGAAFDVSMQRASAAKSSDQPQAKVLGCLKAADALIENSELARAAGEVEEALTLIREHGFEEGRLCTLVIAAKIYAKQGKLSTADQLDEALDLAATAQEKFESIGSKKCEAAAWLALAHARFAVNKFEQGFRACLDAQKVVEKLGEPDLIAEIYQVLASGYCLKDDTQRATAMVEKAKGIHLDQKDKLKQAQCVHRMAKIAIQAGNRNQTETLLARASQMFEDCGNATHHAAVLATERDWHLSKGRVAEGVEAGQRIVTVHHNAGNGLGEANALLSLAQLLFEKNQLDLCEKVMNPAYEIFGRERDGAGRMKIEDLHCHLKNARLKKEIRKSMEDNADFAHYPVDPVLEFGLDKVVPYTLDMVKKGL